MFKQIIVATDGSAASANAAALAVGLARTHGAQLTAVYVVDPYPYLGVGELNPAGFQAYMAAAQQTAAQAHAAIEALCVQGGAPVALQVRLIEDATAVNGILQTAAEVHADLIVMGSHGRTGLARLMLGSVANQVVAESTLPVLISKVAKLA
jgi:nucleotide-binding universal stress UspA family protein